MSSSPAARYADAFFFSVQTFTFVRYGQVAPNSGLANSIGTIEIFIDLLCLALTTGLLFARFARPPDRPSRSSTAEMQS